MKKIVEKSCYICRLSVDEPLLTCSIIADSMVDAVSIFKIMHDSEPYSITWKGNVYCYE